MEKYRLFDKIVKTKTCTFFRAEHIERREHVIVKKLHKETTWEEVLKNKNMALLKLGSLKYLAAITEIIKDQNSFYCILEHMDENLQSVIATELDKEAILKMTRAIIQLLINLSEQKIIPKELRPCFFFVSKNKLSMKLAHLEAYSGKDLTKLDLVELQDLMYQSPESVLTSKPIDERALVFTIGLIICEMILGKPLIEANTKINYIYQLCKLFPEESIEGQLSPQDNLQHQTFEQVMANFDISSEFIALLRQMLKIDKNQRIHYSEILEAFDLIAENQQNFKKEVQSREIEAQITIKPNLNQAPLNREILAREIEFDFQKKPTISLGLHLKMKETTLPEQKNVNDDTVQPIIIKKSSKLESQNLLPVTLNKEAHKMSRATKQQTLSTIRRPQLTNYALNEGNNLGVKLGFNPTLFSENENEF